MSEAQQVKVTWMPLAISVKEPEKYVYLYGHVFRFIYFLFNFIITIFSCFNVKFLKVFPPFFQLPALLSHCNSFVDVQLLNNILSIDCTRNYDMIAVLTTTQSLTHTMTATLKAPIKYLFNGSIFSVIDVKAISFLRINITLLCVQCQQFPAQY